jgi:hypothetical protein
MVVGVTENHYIEFGPRTDGKGYDAKCSCSWSSKKLSRAAAFANIHIHLMTASLKAAGIEL